MDYSYMLVGYLIYYLKPTFLAIFLLNLCSINYFEIYSDKETTANIVKKLGKHKYTYVRHLNGKDIQTGFYLSWACVAFVDRRDYEREGIYLLTSKEHYRKIVEQNTDSQEVVHCAVQPRTLQVFLRRGCYKNFYYTNIRLDVEHIKPMGCQKEIVDTIVDIYRQHTRATVFLHGVSCAGKSTVGYLVAKELNTKFCHSFNPSDPGDQLTSMLNDAGVEEGCPIVLVLEEVDVMIKALHEAKIERNPDTPVSVYNKTTWTNFLDDMVFFKNVILLMTSNTPKAVIDKLDEAYLRQGRVHRSITMPNKLTF
jgi:hypothetical protein